MEYYCSICKEKILEKEQEFSVQRFGKPLCRKHQGSVDYGLSNKETNYKEGMIKGRIAETLIE